jgi:hypothetical protein
MRGSPLTAKRLRWSVLTTMTAVVLLLLATGGAQAVSGPTGASGPTGPAGGSATIASVPSAAHPAANAPAVPLQVAVVLMPQGLPAVLRSGIALRVSANERANGIASVSISRLLAKRAHIKFGHGGSVVIGRGTVSQVKNGTVSLRLKLARATIAKLNGFQHLTLIVHLALVGDGGNRVALDAAGRY